MLVTEYYSDVLMSEKSDNKLIQFVNCSILLGEELKAAHLWVRNGIILDEANVFFNEKKMADIQVDCQGLILSPGFIDLQLNGGFGVDFSTFDSDNEGYIKGLKKVGKLLLNHGVTSFAPTIITSSPNVYKKVLPLLKKTNGSVEGAGVVGAHLEGPFISADKRGCHPKQFVISSLADTPEKSIEDVYGDLANIAIVTIAPELEGANEAIKYLSDNGITVSVGHSSANLEHGERAVNNGASMITHLFNAMQSYHHRDPGLIGLLTSTKLNKDHKLFYGIISDGIHTHDSALRIAHRTNREGMILVTDAIAALGMEDGVHRLGSQVIHVNGLKAILEGTTTTAGSVASMPWCVRHLMKATKCTIQEALICATHKPASLLGITHQKGTLAVGSIADFVLINENVEVKATFCSGTRVFVAK